MTFLQICVDLFLLATSFVDVATVGDLARVTGGSLYHYYPWNAAVDAAQVRELRSADESLLRL
jgi:hypothetical protein